jgi:hypothetical protein
MINIVYIEKTYSAVDDFRERPAMAPKEEVMKNCFMTKLSGKRTDNRTHLWKAKAPKDQIVK